MPQLDKVIFFDQALLISFMFSLGYIYTRCFILPGLSLFFKVRSRFKIFWLKQISEFLQIFLPTSAWIFNRSLAVFFFSNMYIEAWLRELSYFNTQRVHKYIKQLWLVFFSFINFFKGEDEKTSRVLFYCTNVYNLKNIIKQVEPVKTILISSDVSKTGNNIIFDLYSFLILLFKNNIFPTTYNKLDLNIKRWFTDFENSQNKTVQINTTCPHDCSSATTGKISPTTTYLLLEPTFETNVDDPVLLRRPSGPFKLGRALYSAFSITQPDDYIYSVLGFRSTASTPSNPNGFETLDPAFSHYGQSFSERRSDSTGGNSSEFYLHSSRLWTSVGSRTGNKCANFGTGLAVQLQVVSMPCNFSELGFLNALSGYVSFSYLFNNGRYNKGVYSSDSQSFKSEPTADAFTGHPFNVTWQTPLVFDNFALPSQRQGRYVFGSRRPYIFDHTEYFSSDNSTPSYVSGIISGPEGQDRQSTFDSSEFYTINNIQFSQSRNFTVQRFVCLSYAISSTIHTWSDALLSSFISSNSYRRSVIRSTVGDRVASGLPKSNGSIAGPQLRQRDVTSSGSCSNSPLSFSIQSINLSANLIHSPYLVILRNLFEPLFVDQHLRLLILKNNSMVLGFNENGGNYVTISSLFWSMYELLVGEF
jgi:hypothetical protein